MTISAITTLIPRLWVQVNWALVMRRFDVNGESVIQKQQDYRWYFNVPLQGPIPDRNFEVNAKCELKGIFAKKETVRR